MVSSLFISKEILKAVISKIGPPYDKYGACRALELDKARVSNNRVGTR